MAAESITELSPGARSSPCGGYIPNALQPGQSGDLPGLFLGLSVAGDRGAANRRCKRVLVACESSGTVRDAFIKRGHDAWSCDLLPTEKPGPHFTCDVRKVIELGWEWDLLIAHPPCTYLSVSGLHWNTRGRMVEGRPRAELTEEALEFVAWLLGLPIPQIGLENPVGCISSRIRKPDQIVQPWMFGHDASKATCLWLKNLPKLTMTAFYAVKPRIVHGRPRWANQTDSGQNKLPPSKDRWKLRSATYPGIAAAMAEQWGDSWPPTLEASGPTRSATAQGYNNGSQRRVPAADATQTEKTRTGTRSLD